MGAVFFKEIRALFRSIYAIVSISVFAIAAGIIFVLNNVRIGYPSLDSIIATLSLIAAITIPVVACLSVNLERKRRNDEFLASLPLTTAQIVFGKFLALAVFFAVPTAVICLYPVILGFFGQVPYLYSYAAIFFLFVSSNILVSYSNLSPDKSIISSTKFLGIPRKPVCVSVTPTPHKNLNAKVVTLFPNRLLKGTILDLKSRTPKINLFL